MARRHRKQQRMVHPSRRGVVMLMVVSLLVMFLLMAITYAVVSSHYRDAAQSFSRRAFYGDDPRREADLVIHQIVAEPSNAFSALAGQSLLADLYGSDGYVVTNLTLENETAGTTTVDKNPLFTFWVSGPATSGTTPEPIEIAGYYSGCVITMTSGSCKGLSSRILTHSYNSQNRQAHFRVLKFQDEANVYAPSNTDDAIINGRPFNGVGAGHRSGKYANDAPIKDFNASSSDPNKDYAAALLPNLSMWQDRTAADEVRKGHLDEPWDAFDYQNAYLALVPADRGTSGTPGSPITPSFNQPELVNYWLNQSAATLSTNYDLARAIAFRPMPFDHPHFTGSNPYASFFTNANPTAADIQASMPAQLAFLRNQLYQTSGGSLTDQASGNTYRLNPWDVDTDGDGRPDSVWIDPGLPVVTAANGRKYKRLVAVMIRDLDGRVNVNAHGHTHAVETSDRGNSVAGGTLGAYTKGMGYGPAEVDFSNIAGTNYISLLQGRYGADTKPGIQNAATTTYAFTSDKLALIKQSGRLAAYASGAYDSWNSPSDVWGRGAVLLDHAGQPLPPPLVSTNNWLAAYNDSETVDQPYEINLVEGNHENDAPYTVADLEAILRKNDSDASSLSDRLKSLLPPNVVGSSDISHFVSTRSSHVSASRGAVPSYMRSGSAAYGNMATSILDIARARIKQENSGLSTDKINAIVRQTMPFEFFRGELMNLNRPFGDGTDNNGNNVVDEPGETGENAAWRYGEFAGKQPIDVLNNSYLVEGGAAAPTDAHLAARQLYARHLYCLMLLLVDKSVQNDFQYSEFSGATKGQMFRRRLAQWAINVVDFRDSDAIMTPFEYDDNPFDGWDFDGVVADGTTASADDNGTKASQRGLVWGMEEPDLLISEAVSFHDRRVRDTAYDTTEKLVNREMAPGQDPDQLKIPEGSTFIELYCPRRSFNASTKSPPAEVYDVTTHALDLKKAVGNRPVWQIAISQIHTNPGTPNGLPVQCANQQALTKVDSFELMPVSGTHPGTGGVQPFSNTISVSNNGTTNLTLDRFVWFTNAKPGDAVLEDNTFYNSSNTSGLVPAGGYMVIGPRARTTLGGKVENDSSIVDIPEADQEITLSAAGITIKDATGTVRDSAATSSVQTRGMIVDIAPPENGAILIDGTAATNWASKADNITPHRIGLNVSEPLPKENYYLPPTDVGRAYDNLTSPTNKLPDEPFDSRSNSILGKASNSMTATATYAARNTVVLQRLANPLSAWNKFSNPYVTVDWTDLDTTVFSGYEDTDRQVALPMGMGNITLDPKDTTPHDNNSMLFGSRQRGNRAGGSVHYELWNPRTILWNSEGGTPKPTWTSLYATPDGTNVYFKKSLAHSLGYLNGFQRNSSASGLAEIEVGMGAARGKPKKPFEWQPWNNRPFTNPHELMAIPASSPGRFGLEFDRKNIKTSSNPYAADTTSNSYVAYDGEYRHLLPWQLASSGSGTPPTQSFDLYRLFDYVETPSPYVGTEKWFSPDRMNVTSHNNTTFPGVDPFIARAPFNRISNFRDPGRVNINTILEKEVWEAVTAGSDDLKAKWSNLLDSRRGYALPTSSTAAGTKRIFETDKDFPTLFANPFRPADAYDLAPLGYMKQKRPIDSTLLRAEGATVHGTTPPAAGTVPLFAPTARTGAADAYHDTEKNSYFRYQPYAKLSNLVTTNSNCYAVWMTIGYFEVEPNTAGAGGADTAHPDGYALAQELGLDEGNVKRHRSFYIIDRSIPVAFEPGKTHNVDRCILLRRHIE